MAPCSVTRSRRSALEGITQRILIIAGELNTHIATAIHTLKYTPVTKIWPEGYKDTKTDE